MIIRAIFVWFAAISVLLLSVSCWATAFRVKGWRWTLLFLWIAVATQIAGLGLIALWEG